MKQPHSTPKRVLFYSSVRTKRMFSIQQYYKTDINILKELGYKVLLSNTVRDFLAFRRYDIAFIYFYKYGFFAALFAKLCGKKVIFTGGIDYLHLPFAGRKLYTFQRIFFRLSTFFSDVNILVSNSDKKNVEKAIGPLSPQKFPLSFHVVDTAAYRCADLTSKKKLVITISWMLKVDNVLRKGVDKSLLLFKELHQLDPEYRMLIIGPKGEGSDYVEQLIAKEGLSEWVTLTGAIDEATKINYLQESSIYTQLSVYEGFGIASIEAMSAGNIIVHTAQGGLADAAGDNGIVATNEDYPALARKVLAVVENNDERTRIVDRGIGYVTEHFQYQRRYKDFEKIVKGIR